MRMLLSVVSSCAGYKHIRIYILRFFCSFKNFSIQKGSFFAVKMQGIFKNRFTIFGGGMYPFFGAIEWVTGCECTNNLTTAFREFANGKCGYIKSRSCSLTARTGQFTFRITLSAVVPIKNDSRAPCPRVLITTRSISVSSTHLMISL